MLAAAPEWTEIAKGVAAIVQIFAIVVGGSWAYYKFVRGRTFKPRAKLDIAASIVEADDAEKAISFSVSFTNTGLVYISFALEDPICLVRVWGTDGLTPGANPYWGDELILAELFQHHAGCEVGETLDDHKLLPVPFASGSPNRPWRAFRIEVVIVSQRRLLRRARPWRATTFLADRLVERTKDR